MSNFVDMGVSLEQEIDAVTRPRNVLCLDIGLNCGWARSNGTNGCERFAQPDHGRALAEFSDWIEAMLDTEPLACMAVEPASNPNGANGRLCVAMELTAHMHAYGRCIARTERHAGQVRSWLLGFNRISTKLEPSKARRDREMDRLILAAVRARGFSPGNEHSADAIALLCCVENIMPREAA